VVDVTPDRDGHRAAICLIIPTLGGETS
jgi:hypothetical protein